MKKIKKVKQQHKETKKETEVSLKLTIMLLMKKYKQLTSEQRYAIYLALQKGISKSKIAESIQVDRSTVYRELNRNKNKSGGYSWRLAQEMAEERKERLPGNKSTPEWIKQKVIRLIRKDWSPKQISGYLLKFKQLSISHETIYKWIREDRNNGGDLYKHCRHKLKYRKRVVGSAKNIPNRTSIRERPKEADGSRFGDFEMDTIMGNEQKEVMLTLTERKTNFVMMRKLPNGKDSKKVAEKVIAMLLPYKSKLKTITTDNGSEFAAHELITKRLKVQVYFTDPYSSWQKGAVENANKLIRQYIPKGAAFSEYSDKNVSEIQHKLNERPREKLGFYSPKFEFYKKFN